MDRNSTSSTHPAALIRAGAAGRRYFFVFLGVALLLALGGLAFYTNQAHVISERQYNELSYIAQLKVDQIVHYRAERLNRVRRNADSQLLGDMARQWQARPGDPALKQALLNEFRLMLDGEGIQDVILATVDGRVLLSLNPGLTELDTACRSLVGWASEGGPTLGDLIFDTFASQVVLDTAAPLSTVPELSLVLVMRVDPARYLFPLVQSWPTASKTAETLLVRRDGDETVFLNPLRHVQNTPLEMRIPVTNTAVAAVQAVLGHTGRYDGFDYRGVSVVASIFGIPNSNWSLVSKADTTEILAEMTSIGYTVLVFVILAMLASGALAAYLANDSRRRIYQEMLHAEQELRVAEDRFASAFRANPAAMAISREQDGVLLDVNLSYAGCLGYQREEMIGRSGSELGIYLHPSDREQILGLLSQGTVQNAEIALKTRVGEVRNVLFSVDRIQMGGEACLLIAFQDITQQKQAQTELQVSEARLAQAQAIAHVGSWEINLRSREMWASVEAFQIYGLDRQTPFMPLAVAQKIPLPEERARLDAALTGLLKSEAAYDLVFRIQRASDSAIRVIHSVASLVKDEGGQPRKVVGVLQDITAQAEAQEALRRSEIRFRTTLYSIGDGVITTDMDGKITQMNPVAEQLTAWTEAEALGQPVEAVFQIANEQSNQPVETPVQRILREGQVIGLANHTLLIARDGTRRPIADSGAPVRDETGQISGVVLVFRDQTAERKAEGRLHLVNFALDHIVDAAYWISPDGKLVDANLAAADMLGYTREELLCLEVYQVDADFSAADWPQHWRELKQKGSLLFPSRHITRDGRLIPVEITANYLYYDHQEWNLALVRDVSERRRVETQLNEQLDELRRWHAITLGREERILELKDEVNQWMARSGQPPRYASTRGIPNG